MNTLYTGFIEQGVIPYTIIDTEVSFDTIPAGLAFLDELADSLVVSTSGQSNNNGSYKGTNLENTINNPWAEIEGFSQTTIIEFPRDYGFIVKTNGGSTSNVDRKILVADGVRPLYRKLDGSYNLVDAPNMLAPNNGSVGINLNNSALTHGQIVLNSYIYSNDVIRYHMKYLIAKATEAYLQVHPDGSIFFFSTTPAVVNITSGTSANLTYVGDLLPNRVYCLRASAAQAHGTVYNPSGNPAPNCSVMAFDRVSGKLVGKTKSDALGAYSMLCVAKKGTKIFMVCLDDDGVAPDFDAQIFDRVEV